MLQLEGVPKRCFTVTMADGSKFKFCIYFNQWPTIIRSAYPKHPEGDPGPILQIEGVEPAILRDLEVLDGIQELSNILSAQAAKLVREAVGQGLRQIKQKLPPNLSLDA